MQNIPARTIPSLLIYTLEDDNVGLLPQLTTGSLCQLTRELIRHGWAGFSTHYWMIDGQDPYVAYLSRAAWHGDGQPTASIAIRLVPYMARLVSRIC